jgi:rRNA biogenesis protein RRP5
MLRDGMNVLCRVLDVKEMDLTVSLPGRISATIPITEISDPYTKLLNRLAQDEDVDAKSLKEMFSVGQVFPCSIKEASDESSNKIVASLNPSDVNKEIPVSALSKGLAS